MTARLNTLDRSTLIVWRVSNLLGWPALGVLIAIQAHWFVVQTWGLQETAGYHLAWPGEGSWTQPLHLVIGARAIVAVLAGLAIGMFARRVYRGRVSLAVLGGLAYVVIVVSTLEHNAAGAQFLFGLGDLELDARVPNSVGRALMHDAFISAAIPIAALRARA